MKKKMGQILQQILDSATNQGYRSNVIKPITGLSIIALAGCIISFYLELTVLAYFLLGIMTLSFLACVVAYFYCLFKNPDWLRSEKFNLEKTAIQTYVNNSDSVNGHPTIKLKSTDYVTMSGCNNSLPQETLNEEERS